MRLSRSIQLPENEGYVHKFWKCHNGEFLLQTKKSKQLLESAIGHGLRKEITENNVGLIAFDTMDNHCHQLLYYKNSSKHLSKYMHATNTKLGRTLNDYLKRSGKVANERPKTPLIQDQLHSMRVQFYIEANPIRAGICNFEQLRFYKHSSFPFYAYGDEGPLTDILDVPDWYLELGETPKQRQKRYRQLFKEYLGIDSNCSEAFQKSFIGSTGWTREQAQRARENSKRTRGLIREMFVGANKKREAEPPPPI